MYNSQGILVELEQSSSEWHEFRSLGIGSSDANCIAGMNPFRSVSELWNLKTGKTKDDGVISPAMQHGIDLEPVARKEFIKITGLYVEPKCFIHEDFDFLRASLDGIDNTHKKVLEIKCPTRLGIHRKVMKGIVPSYYYPQLQHQLMVTGAEISFYWSYTKECGGFLVVIERNESFIDELLEREYKFWNHVKADVPVNENDFPVMSLSVP